MTTELSAEEIYKYDKHFTNIYDSKGDEVNPVPKGKKVTVYCDDGDDEVGYCIDVTSDELGIQAFIAKRWILHSELLELINKRPQ